MSLFMMGLLRDHETYDFSNVDNEIVKPRPVIFFHGCMQIAK